MALYYVGAGGSDANNGTSYANRKLTLTGAEDIPVVAGDTVYVAPGVFRELLTLDVSGTAGNPITYIADVDGSHTDLVGGIVRITGSDNDTTATRANCITATSRNYRTFRGFTFDTATGVLVTLITACGNWIIEDCYFQGQGAAVAAIQFAGTGITNTVRRCTFFGGRFDSIIFTHSATVDTSANLVENCLFVGNNRQVVTVRVGGITIKNCTFLFPSTNAVRVNTALTTGQTTTMNNCIVAWSLGASLQAVTAPGTNEEITENYNSFWGNNSDRTNVTAGANSNAYPPLLAPPMMLAGFRYPWNPFDLSQWSNMRVLAGTSMAADGIYGITRPTTDAKKSWGAMQWVNVLREATTVRTGAASLEVANAGRHQMFVPVTAVSTTISCYVQWTADYTGTKPQMVIKQPGQSDVTVTATGSSGAWELLTTTLTPVASPGYVVVELVSNNTNSTYSPVFFDDIVRVP